MKKKFFKQVTCFTLVIMLVLGMLPGMPLVAYADSIPITEVYITVPEPIAGEHPCYNKNMFVMGGNYYIEANTNDDYYWYYYDDQSNYHTLTAEDTFQAGIEYSLNIGKLWSKDGYYFILGNEKKVYVNNQETTFYYSGEYMAFNYTFPPAKQRIDSIELYHETDVEAKNSTKNLAVSKINGEAFDGEKYAGFTWFRSSSNFSDINDAGVTVWDDSQDGYKFVGGYAYGLRIDTLPEIEGYVYGPTVVVSLKTPSSSKTATTDAYDKYYFFFDKLAYKPDLETVNITMDGYYVGENILDLTFSSNDSIKTDGGYGANSGRYTIRNYNEETHEYDILSNSAFVAERKYYLFYYLESDLGIKGLERENVKVNGIAAFAKGEENTRTYYAFSLPILEKEDIKKTEVSSVIISMPKAQPVAGDTVYYPTVVSVNGDVNLANAISVNNSQWYQCDYHTEEAYYEPINGNCFEQNTSYLFWLELFCSNEYVLADNCTMTLQTPSGNLEGEPDYKGTTSLEYKYYFNLGAPTELPALTSYAGTLSGYHAGVQVENTQLEIMANGKKIPEVMKYGMSYALLDENHQFIEQGTIKYDTQYYCSMMVAPYNCKKTGFTVDKVKEVATLNGLKPESVTETVGIYLATFKLPILKENATCNGFDHDFKKVLVPATFEKDGKSYEICTKGCGTIQNETVIPCIKTVKISKESYVYNGKAKHPTVTVKDRTGAKLAKNTDYTVTVPKGRTAIGKYTYTIIFKGKYAGAKSKKLTFTIKPAKPSIQKPKAEKKAITVKWKKTPKSQTTGYQVMAATDKNFKKNVKKVYVKGYRKTSYTMKKLKAKTKYYVKVRTYKTVKGKKIYSDWSKVKTIKTK